MRFLLPPSEGKAPGGSGAPLGESPALGTPALAGRRARLMVALSSAAATDPDGLAAGLRLPSSVRDAALAADAALAVARTRKALDRYAGVVYQALDARSLTRASRAKAEEQVLVLSGLWGVVAGADRVPDYRVPASGFVPGVGGVTAYWRRPLAEVLPGLLGDEPVLDLRSTDYLAMWRPAGDLRERVVTVRVLAERRVAGRTVVGPVSFHAKSVKGRVVRHLVSGRRRFSSAVAAAEHAAAALGLEARVTQHGAGRGVDLLERLG